MRVSRVALLVVLMGMTTAAFAQTDAQKQAFARLKTLAGTWEGTMQTTPKAPGADGVRTRVTFRVTSMGNTLMHEMTGEGRPDNPITMLYLEDDRVALTHYCDAGNRPRMVATVSPDGKKVEFQFTDLSGGTAHGHMHGAAFTFVDEDHHTEDWTFMMPGGKPMQVHVEMTRSK